MGRRPRRHRPWQRPALPPDAFPLMRSSMLRLATRATALAIPLATALAVASPVAAQVVDVEDILAPLTEPAPSRFLVRD